MPEAGSGIGRVLMLLGGTLFLIGALLAFGVSIPRVRLPGDIVIRREGGSFYFPVVTCLVLSALLSFVSWLLRR